MTQWSPACCLSGCLPVCEICIILYVIGQCIIIISTVISHGRETFKIIYFDWKQWFQSSTYLTWSTYIQEAVRILDCVAYIIETSLFMAFWDYKALIKFWPVSLPNSYPAKAIVPPSLKAVFPNQGFLEAYGSTKHHKGCTKNHGIHL